jgi:hypothetical protein
MARRPGGRDVDAMISGNDAAKAKASRRDGRAWAWSVAALVVASVAIAALWRSGARHAWPLAVQFAACGAWWVAAFRVPPGRRPWIFACGAAFATRLPLWFVPPAYSDDLYRYMWEGRVQVAGENPFITPPASPLLSPLDADGLVARVNHSYLAAIYPPSAQVLFAAGAWLGADASPVAFKLWLALWEAAALFAIACWARRRFGSRERALRAWQAIALHPLVVVETAGNGHYDLLVAGVVALFFLAIARRRFAWSGVALGVGFAAKFLPAAAGLALLWRGRRGAFALLLAGATIGCLYLPYIEAGPRLFNSLDEYALKWERNAPVVPALAWICDATGLADLADRSTWGDDPTSRFIRARVFGLHPEAPHARQVAKRIAALLFLAIACGVALSARRRARRTGRPPAAEPMALTLFASAMLLAPILYPWYLLLLAPMLALSLDERRPLAGRVAWAWLLAAAPIFYLPVEPGVGKAPLLFEAPGRWIVFAPFATLMAIAWREGRAKRESPRTARTEEEE